MNESIVSLTVGATAPDKNPASAPLRAMASPSGNATAPAGEAPNAPNHATMSRRQAIQWVMAAVAASALPTSNFAAGAAPLSEGSAPLSPAKGYGGDPDLKKEYNPGAFWPLTFTAAQREAATALADVILPKDHLGPAASEVGVLDMLDEWISAPYPAQKSDRPIILDGLAWLDVESQRRFTKRFAQLSEEQKHTICDDICFPPAAKPEFKRAAAFFSRFRSLCAGAYYATPPGWEAIGYIGNTPSSHFDGPPPQVLEKLGVTQTVV